jgi:hypothetical protein
MSRAPTALSEQNVSFADANASYSYHVDSEPDATFKVSDSNDADLNNFFSRPLKVTSIDWATGSTLFTTFNPWQLYFENPRVINRISNYNLLRAKLCMKIVLNGNSFHYGRAIVSYVPLASRDQLTVDRAFFLQDVVAASQRPHFYLDPTYSQGGSMCLPFFWNQNYLSIPNQEWRDMGEVWIHGMQDLKHANGATDSVTVSVFVWAEDVSLAIPTNAEPGAIAPQSGEDEYGTGPVSWPASVLARAAGSLVKAPIIGPYAKATQLAASATANIAQIFGFSRPVSVEQVQEYTNRPGGNLVNTNTIDTSHKLSLDVKQETTVDPRTVGLAGTDEMEIRSIAKRESFLGNFGWTTATAPETLLFQCRVSPMVWNSLALSGQTEYHLPACAFAAMPFEYWRGSMEFRFQVVASNFHRGRLKIVYEPHVPPSTTAEYNTNYTHILDIADEKDVKMKIGWGNQYGFARVSGFPDGTINRPQIWRADGVNVGVIPNENFNGYISVYVVNELTVPNSTANNDIEVNVFVNMCDDFEVASPTSQAIDVLSLYTDAAITAQSGEEEINDLEKTVQASAPMQESNLSKAPTLSPSDNTMDVYFGEKVTSFRQCLKRYCLHEQITIDAGSGSSILEVERCVLPYYRGYDPNGLTSTANGPFNYSHTTLLNWVLPAFTGWRGSVRWKCLNMGRSDGDAEAGFIRRLEQPYPGPLTLVTSTATTGIARKLQYVTKFRSTWDGVAYQSPGLNTVAEAEIPFYRNKRFLYAKRNDQLAFSPDVLNDLGYEYIYRSTVNSSDATDINTYCSVGEDFSCFFFTGCPVVYVVGNPAV